MLRYELIHPPLLEALAACGHGSRVLFADGNFPASTVAPAGAQVIHLNVAPGLLTVMDVLRPVLTAVRFESAVMMEPPGGETVDAERDYAAALGEGVPITRVERFAFYDAVRSPEVGLVVATADERTFANILLTVGLR